MSARFPTRTSRLARSVAVRLSPLGTLAVLGACAGAPSAPSSQLVGPPATSSAPAAAVDSPYTWPVRQPRSSDEGAVYAAQLEKLGDVEFEQVPANFGPLAAESPSLGFDPASAQRYTEVSRTLAMTAGEKAVFRRLGFVSLSRPHLGSMAGAYFRIYNMDLPVIVTTDSILDALHRSIDEALKRIERAALIPALGHALEAMHARLATASASAPRELQVALRDVDLYLTIARNLLAGSGSERGGLAVRSVLRNDDDASRLLWRINAAAAVAYAPLYGTQRLVDFSQFNPRGHYSEAPDLERYFKAMMWLGRADLGFELVGGKLPESGDAMGREDTDAALLSWLVQDSGQAAALSSMGDLIAFLVGQPDSATPMQVSAVMKSAGVTTLAQLAEPSPRRRLAEAVRRAGLGSQRIQSQVLHAAQGPARTPNPSVLQLFGQSFAIDSFALSNVVYDQIGYRGEKVRRTLPSGLDVMASLGNPEAVAQLEPELRQWHYGANLLAVRHVVESYDSQAWSSSLYNGWLDALRSLDDRPGGAGLPQAMRSRAWERKQLQTQLASWAQLRHDMMLYVKQSYSEFACSYPAGYVEPYPDFYARMGNLAEAASARVSALDLPAGGDAPGLASLKTGVAGYFRGFAATMKRLESLARKELASEPFSKEERDFLSQLMDKRGRGSGPPRYDGWYPGLVFDNPNDQFKPVVADVHTDPNTGNVLHVAVGNTRLMVIAVDNQSDRAVYVGPVFSYHEFLSPVRHTDGLWASRLESEKPASPEWVSEFSP